MKMKRVTVEKILSILQGLKRRLTESTQKIIIIIFLQPNVIMVALKAGYNYE